MKKLFLSLVVVGSLFASDSDILLKTQKDILDTSKNSAEQSSEQNARSWLSDVTLSASTSIDEDSDRTDDIYIDWSQDVYRFGGIRYQIKYADIKKEYDFLGVDIQERTLLSSLFETLANIKITELEISQTELNIKNSDITIELKKDSYSAGDIDISDLNDAIMAKNAYQETLISLRAAQSRYINSLKELTDAEYKNIEFPEISMISQEEYLKNSTTLKQLELDADVKNYTSKITDSSYLPTLEADLQYGQNEIENSTSDGEYYNYGLTLSMPISFSTSSTKQIAKLDYLKSKQELLQNKKSIEVEYKESLINIQSYKQMKKVASDDIELYDSLLELTQGEYEAGYKPIEDVMTLKNTKNIRELDVKINDLNIKKELLSLYFNMKK